MTSTSTYSRMPVIFFGHGSPMNALDDNRATRAWAALGAAAAKPRAILMISAHWLPRGVAVTAMDAPRTIHDFGAFPAELFAQRYPAPGDPALARRVAELLSPVPVKLDDTWGFDHGTWSVLLKAYPRADIPVVQLGLDRTRDARAHYELGRALRPLRDEGVLIAASGNVVHNLGAMDWSARDCAYDWAQSFNDYIAEAIVADRPEDAIRFMEKGAMARHSVPSPDHYWPLLYALGARHADDPVRLETNFLEHGSLSMLSFLLGKPVPALEAV